MVLYADDLLFRPITKQRDITNYNAHNIIPSAAREGGHRHCKANRLCWQANKAKNKILGCSGLNARRSSFVFPISMGTLQLTMSDSSSSHQHYIEDFMATLIV